ncbi:hypothetical protein SDC9_209687 [bioreactor metagenome]|uniref:Uncharacterized protein n=1 Tax=bioreactor metagenome TaxID=1076179 RepID=A0A645JEB9_9ZZZZ
MTLVRIDSPARSGGVPRDRTCRRGQTRIVVVQRAALSRSDVPRENARLQCVELSGVPDAGAVLTGVVGDRAVLHLDV